MKRILLPFGFLVYLSTTLCAQSVYMAASSFTESSIWLMDYSTCERIELYSNITPNIDDFVEVPGGFVYLHTPNSGSGQFHFFNPATGVSTLLVSYTAPSNQTRLLLISPTEILFVTNNVFRKLDLTTNTITLLATFPPVNFIFALFTHDGQIHYCEVPVTGPQNLYTISLTPTLQRTLVATFDTPEEFPFTYELTAACDKVVSPGSDRFATVFNMNNYTGSMHCSFENGISPTLGLLAVAPILAGTTGPLCGCTAEAGTWDWTQPPLSTSSARFEACIGGTIELTHNGDQILPPGYNLVFVLFDPYEPPSAHVYESYDNIIHIYDTPNLFFIPGVTEPNRLYRILPVVSQASPGSVDLTDPCRDLQLDIFVVWRTPTVNFFVQPLSTCSTGCRTVQVEFQGVLPFQLSYEVMMPGQPTQVFNQVFTNMTGNFTVCPPANFEGEVQINALSLTDGDNCTCN
jgi:hypothetical protein